MTDLLSLSFFRHALIMGGLLSLLFGLLSFFIVIRRMTFLGAGIAHTAFGGVALGVLLGVHPFMTSALFCTASALIIGRLVKRETLNYDTAIGIFFALAMALGAIFIALRKAYTFDLSGYLFGNILGVTQTDLWLAAATLALFIPFYLGFFQKLLFNSFDERVASTSGVKSGALESALLVFLALIIVVSIKMVGIILVSALVVLPASFGLLISREYKKVIAASILFTLVTMTGGLLASYSLDSPAGATMVVLGALIYFLTLIFTQSQ